MAVRDDDFVDAAAPKKRVNRRAVIKKGLVAGGVGYVAPMILGSATPVSAAAVSSACGCNTQLPCNFKVDCGPGGACFCWVLNTHNGCFCGDGNPCPGISCTTQADCTNQGFPTYGCVDTCCSGFRCWPPCGTPLNGPAGPGTGTR